MNKRWTTLIATLLVCATASFARAGSLEDLQKQIDELIAAKETRVILDMAGVTHMDSAAIGAIVRCLMKLKQSGGGLRMAGVQSMIEYSLKLTKVDKLIPAFKTVTEAASGFSAKGAA